MVLDFDLNDPPPCEDSIIGIPFRSAGAQELQEEQPLQSEPQDIIDLEAIDDDVVLSSPRSFYEARSKSWRDLELIAGHDEEPLYKGVEISYSSSVLFPQNHHKRRRIVPHQKDANWDCCRNLEASTYTETFCTCPPQELPPSVPPQVVPAFTCPVCMGPLVKETTTKCGHIFCEKCIKAAIAAQHKCPTCRQKLTVKSTFRIYLPATS